MESGIKLKGKKAVLVEGYCRRCDKQFDAHWHNYPGEEVKRMLNPQCPYCKIEGSENMATWTDEDNSSEFDDSDWED